MLLKQQHLEISHEVVVQCCERASDGEGLRSCVSTGGTVLIHTIANEYLN